VTVTTPVHAGEAVPFSHKRHAELKIECVYCHAKAASGERAGFPAASKCMVCHREAAKDAEPIRRLAALAADTTIVPEKPLYVLPDFVFFSHARHKKECQTCHGNVWAGDTVTQQLQMKMKACIDCHKENHAVVTCTVCHELGQ
jgi:Class III cytochrome C family